jgi:hypothetical protein
MAHDRELDLEPIRDRIRNVTGLPSAIPQGPGESVRDLIFDALELIGEVDRLRRERDSRDMDQDALVRALYGPELYERLTEIVDARHGPGGPLDAQQAYGLAMAELWREGELRWFPTSPGPWPREGIVYDL